MNPEQAKLNRLYRLLDRLERENNDQDTIASLRWAISTIERTYNITLSGGDQE